MILTVTLNSAVDKVLLLDELTPGLPMPAHGEVSCVGGKGLDASVVLRHLGVETVGLAFVAGQTGRQLEALLQAYGIVPELVWVTGETRVIYVLAESRKKRISHIKLGGMKIDAADQARFLAAYQARLAESQWVICAGSPPAAIPVDFYARLARMAADYNVPFMLDAPDEMMLSALQFRPVVAKLNWEEFEATFGIQAANLDDLAAAAAQVASQFSIRNLVLTCAAQGILALTEKSVYHALAPAQDVINAAGAGDAVSAALAWRLSMGDAWPEALRWAAASAAAVVRTPGTADCRREDVEAIFPEVIINEISLRMPIAARTLTDAPLCPLEDE